MITFDHYLNIGSLKPQKLLNRAGILHNLPFLKKNLRFLFERWPPASQIFLCLTLARKRCSYTVTVKTVLSLSLSLRHLSPSSSSLSKYKTLTIFCFQDSLRIHRLQHTGPGPHTRLPPACLLFLLCIPNHHRLLHDQHLRRFRYRHLPKRG